jgi:ATP-dependent DNA helicase PIF1
MGGKLVVLMHDFRQLLPVVKNGSRGDIVHACVTFSKVWPHFKTLQLNTNMRVELLRMNNDLVQSQLLHMHSKWLLSVGEGTLDYAIPNSNIFEIPSQMVCSTVSELESRVYSDIQQHYMDPEYLRDRAIMSCTNDVIQECNQRIVASLPGQPVICESTYRFVNDNDNLQHDIGSLRCINPSGLPPHLLQLKVGTCIILIRNLNIKEGHCNGTRYIILSLTRRCIRAKKLNSVGDGNDEIFIPRIPLHSNDTDYPVPFVRTQFPVLVSYYLTISRAQGQTFKQAGMYLPRNVFAHGHMYVGMSRCGDPNGLHIFADQGEFVHVAHMLHESKSYSKNVVYSEMLR